jgi:tRNA threonylcarbamoyladenosine biosynthesis protein TsaB
MKKDKIILAIESGVGSGSLSLLRNGQEVDSWVGTNSISRAESLLEEISKLLTRNEISNNDIDIIAVSNEIGSHTGLRIGLSTVLGLSRAFFCDIRYVSLFEPFLLPNNDVGKILCGASGNQKNVFAQLFMRDSAGNITRLMNPKMLSLIQFIELIKTENPNTVIVNSSLIEIISEIPAKIVDVGNNLAKLIGVYANTEITDKLPSIVNQVQI